MTNDRPIAQTIFLAVFLPTLLLIATTVLYITSKTPPYYEPEAFAKILYRASWLCPLPFAFWLGLQWRGSHTLAYIFLGALIGCMALLAYIVTYNVTFPEAGGRFAGGSGAWMSFFARYPLLDTFMFTVGGVIGDSLEGKIKEERITPYAGIIGAVVTAISTIVAPLLGGGG